MGTFKEGDWVRATTDYDPIVTGDVGRVTKSGTTAPFVSWSGKRIWAYAQKNLEPWTPSVGDRVRVTGNEAWAGVGEVYDLDYSVVYVKMLDGQRVGCSGGFPLGEVEPFVEGAKFKVGDLVRLLTTEGFDDSQVSVGSIAKVTSAPISRDALYSLEFNKPFGGTFAQAAFARDIELVDQQATTTPLQIEAGRYYKTRDGRKVGPMEDVGGDKDHWRGGIDGDHSYWHDNGSNWSYKESATDLIALWQDDPANDNATMPQLGTAIVCVFKDGKPAPAMAPKVHDDVDSARAEAKRLGGERRGETFGVYKLVATHKQRKPEYAHEWQRLAVSRDRCGAIVELRRVSGLSYTPAKSAVEGFIDHLAA